jgi:hypothetical protein
MNVVSVGDIFKLCELSMKVYKNCRDCSGEYKSLTSQARALTNLLEDIQDKYGKIPQNKRQQLFDAYEPCIDVLQELDKLVAHYNGLDSKSKRAWDRVTYDPGRTTKLRDRLVSSVSMLSAFYTSLIHDSQVLILEALGRLEKDYKGGHREGSIASIERITSATTQGGEEDDDAAWKQILRDLEDVGVSQQDALSYREVVIDWLVTAVNEGRLLEERPKEDIFSSMSQDNRSVPPPVEFTRWSHDLEISAVPPPIQSSASSSVAHPLASPSMAQDKSLLSPSGISGRESATSLQNMPRKSQSAISSLCAPPEPLSAVLVAPSKDSSISAIRKAPLLSHDALPHATLSHTLPEPSYAPPTAPPSAPPMSNIIPNSGVPLSYYENDTSTTADLEWTRGQIMAAWTRNDFAAATNHLEEQLKAVERGQTSTLGTQPDRRVLRHLIGVCASLNGDFPKAKRLFESVFNGVDLNRQNLDDGDISAARWLGDVCLHMQEHKNAALAYSVAYEGSVGRLGASHARTQQVVEEIKLLDHWLWVFKRIELSVSRNVDPTNIFTSVDVALKSNMMMAIKDRLCRSTNNYTYLAASMRPALSIPRRPKCDFQISEGFLLGPLISLNTWPLPWDPMFSPMDAVQLDRYMDTVGTARFARPLAQRGIPTNTLGNSKKLHYLTKRGLEWLIDTVKVGLRDIGIEHAENPFDPSIICRLYESRDGVSFSKGLEICFSKLPFRDVYGIKITDVKWATRRFAGKAQELFHAYLDTSDLRSIVRSILENAEADVGYPKPKQRRRHNSMYSGQQSTKAATTAQELDSKTAQELDSTATQELDSMILPAELYSPPETTQAAIDSVLGRPDIHEIGTSNESGVRRRN